MTDQPAPRRNALGQPIGEPLHEWSPPPLPQPRSFGGQWCTLEPLTVESHAAALWDAYALDTEHRNWTYLVHGPYESFDDFGQWARRASSSRDPLFFAILDARGRAVGVAAYLRIAPEAGSIEVGHINMSPLLQRTPAATEAMYLLMRHAFELGYRRYEWKCDALNQPSRAAAERLGFIFEGVFRQATIYKGRNRDTAWYSIVDHEWPPLRRAFEQWLMPENFDAAGRQRTRLSELVSSARISRSRA
jgi:RimJ/RimL family protein N-acetyltransferase